MSAPPWSAKISRFVTRGPSSNLYRCSVCYHVYAFPSFAGQLSKGDKSRINALFRKALKRGLCHTSLEIDELIVTADKRLFGHISRKTHCLHHLAPQRNVRTASSLRTRGHNFTLPHTDFSLYKNSFINRCLFQF